MSQCKHLPARRFIFHVCFKHHILLFKELCVPLSATSQLLLFVHMGKFFVKMELQEMDAPLAPPVCLQDLPALLFIPVS